MLRDVSIKNKNKKKQCKVLKKKLFTEIPVLGWLKLQIGYYNSASHAWKPWNFQSKLLFEEIIHKKKIVNCIIIYILHGGILWQGTFLFYV